jgi:hypothetical protein
LPLIASAIKSIPGVTTGTHIPATEDNKMPTLKVTWDPNKIKLTNVEMGERLRKGNPSVEVISWEAPNTLTLWYARPRSRRRENCCQSFKRRAIESFSINQ